MAFKNLEEEEIRRLREVRKRNREGEIERERFGYDTLKNT
jgi:hypothetical protein